MRRKPMPGSSSTVREHPPMLSRRSNIPWPPLPRSRCSGVSRLLMTETALNANAHCSAISANDSSLQSASRLLRVSSNCSGCTTAKIAESTRALSDMAMTQFCNNAWAFVGLWPRVARSLEGTTGFFFAYAGNQRSDYKGSLLPHVPRGLSFANQD